VSWHFSQNTVQSCWGDGQFVQQSGETVVIGNNGQTVNFPAGGHMRFTCGDEGQIPPVFQQPSLNNVLCSNN